MVWQIRTHPSSKLGFLDAAGLGIIGRGHRGVWRVAQTRKDRLGWKKQKIEPQGQERNTSALKNKGKKERSSRDLNPGRRIESPVSLTGLDD